MSKAQTYKLVVFGAGGVGKSAVSLKYLHNSFPEKYDPTIQEVYLKQDTIDGEVAIIEFVDTAGQEQYASVRARFYEKADGFLAVYSVTDRSSFQEIERLRDEVLEKRRCDWVPMVLVANKCDLVEERKVGVKEGEALAAAWFDDGRGPVPFLETSAKENTNIHEVFHQVIREVRKSRGGDAGGSAAPQLTAADTAGAATPAPVVQSASAPGHVDPTQAAAGPPGPANPAPPTQPASNNVAVATAASPGAQATAEVKPSGGATSNGGKPSKDAGKKDEKGKKKKKKGKKKLCAVM